MRVLFDHCVPRPLAHLLPGHEVRTTYRMGWADRSNGDLLALASEHFDVLVTTDRRMQNQQNVGSIPIAVVVLVAVTNTIEDLSPLAPEILRLLGAGLQRKVYVVARRSDRR